MRSLTALTAGLAGAREPAQPLVTLLDGPARVELSGVTAANWAAKTAHLLTDVAGAPARVGIALPLHWQAVTLLLGAVVSGAEVVVATPGAGVAELADCDVVFTPAELAGAALDAGAGDVVAVSSAPLGGRLAGLPPLVLDAGTELPGHGDVWTGPLPATWRVVLGGQPVAPADVGLRPGDRVLTVLPPGDPDGLALGLLAPLLAGAGLLLCPSGAPDEAALRAEGVTAAVGVDLPGVRRLDGPAR